LVCTTPSPGASLRVALTSAVGAVHNQTVQSYSAHAHMYMRVLVAKHVRPVAVTAQHCVRRLARTRRLVALCSAAPIWSWSKLHSQSCALALAVPNSEHKCGADWLRTSNHCTLLCGAHAAAHTLSSSLAHQIARFMGQLRCHIVPCRKACKHNQSQGFGVPTKTIYNWLRHWLEHRRPIRHAAQARYSRCFDPSLCAHHGDQGCGSALLMCM
jgi:hypothetical protein